MAVASLRPENIIPFITTEFCFTIAPSQQKTFVVEGVNFTPDTQLSIPSFDGTIDAVTPLSPHKLQFTITSGPAQSYYDLVTTNRAGNTEWTGNGVNLLRVVVSDWVDLRFGGAIFTHGNGAGNDIRYRAGMDMFRDADGMWFTGANPWSSWVKFENLWWTRGDSKTIQWVFSSPTAAIMIGIGSDATNESSTAQYNQAEMVAYFTSATSFSRLYGNNGTVGVTGYDGSQQSFSNAGLKIKLTHDGTVGPCVFTLYGLAGIQQVHWDDESTVLTSWTVGGSLNPDELHIMPFIIPRDAGAQRFVALKVI